VGGLAPAVAGAGGKIESDPPRLTHASMTAGWMYDFRQTAAVFPRRSATSFTARRSCLFTSLPDAAGATSRSARTALTVPTHVRKSLAVKSPSEIALMYA